MTRLYENISSQQVQKHIDQVKQEIEILINQQSKSELMLNFGSGYTKELIMQTERYHKNLDERQFRIKVLKHLLDELETRALPAALESEKNRMIIERESRVKTIENQIEMLRESNTNPVHIKSAEKELEEAKISLLEVSGTKKESNE